ncbi:MAG: Putative lipid A export permease/ATP-binding protein MsbA [Microgenomates bacterium 39_7]|nr:MAG: Putative lipid A export permease/ATP-binding protein MsbA [Microgenomates bacterium 39_7]
MFKRIFGYAKPYWRTLVTLAVLIALMAGLQQVSPFVSKQITDLLIDEGLASFDTILLLLLLVLVTKFIQTGLNRLTWFMTNIFVVKFEIHLKQIGFDHLMGLSLSYYNEQATGKVMSKLDRGVNRIINIVNNSGMHFLPSVTSALISFIIAMNYEWRLAFLIILGFVPYIAINRWRFKRNNELERQEYKLYDNQYSHFWEVLNSMSLIKAFRAEDYERQRFQRFFKKYMAIRQEMETNTNKAVVGDFFLELMLWGMYAYIVWLTWQGQLTVGTLVMLVSLIQLMREPLWQLNWIFWEIKRAQVGAKDFFKIMDVDQHIPDPKKPVKLKNVKGKFVFDNVSFVYRHEDWSKMKLNSIGEKDLKSSARKNLPVLKDVSFTIEPGKMTALVGPSGAGKTTIASLLLRFFDPDKGKILLDDVDIKRLSKQELRSYIGLVSQDSNLFATTIAENLRYAKPNATKAEMMEACKIAYADKFISQLPNGLETEIGERGVKLSGGQRQRLSIARTVLANPKIIILDEATSSLDSESELYIQRALKKLLKNKTSVVIAHRLSTIQQADKIIVLKEQEVLEEGTHQELLKNKKLYSQLFSIQAGQTKLLKEWGLVH